MNNNLKAFFLVVAMIFTAAGFVQAQTWQYPSAGNATFAGATSTGTAYVTNLAINQTTSGNAQIYFKNQGSLDWDLGTQVGEATQNFNLYNRGTSSVAFSINKASNKAIFGGEIQGAYMTLDNPNGQASFYFKSNGASNWDLGVTEGSGIQNFGIYNRLTSTYAVSFIKASNKAIFGGEIQSPYMTLDNPNGQACFYFKSNGASNWDLGVTEGSGIQNFGIYNRLTGTYAVSFIKDTNKAIFGGEIQGAYMTLDNPNGQASFYFKSNGASNWDLGVTEGSGIQNFGVYNRLTSTYALTFVKASNNAIFTGNVLIGKTTEAPGANYKIDVNGSGRFNEVVVNTTGSDFVFEKNYKLRPLQEVESFIKANNHLPEIASAKEMQENGVGIGEFQTQLLQKVEELTLYMIEMKKENENQQKQIAAQQAEIEVLKKQIQ